MRPERGADTALLVLEQFALDWKFKNNGVNCLFFYEIRWISSSMHSNSSAGSGFAEKEIPAFLHWGGSERFKMKLNCQDLKLFCSI